MKTGTTCTFCALSLAVVYVVSGREMAAACAACAACADTVKCNCSPRDLAWPATCCS